MGRHRKVAETPTPKKVKPKVPAPRVWQVLERSAYNEDGSLWFPTRLTEQFLEDQKKSMKPWLFASQYLNKPISEEDQRFKPEWIVYRECYVQHSEGRTYLVFSDEGTLHPCNVFTTVDPAISDRSSSDYTGIVTLGVIEPNTWVVLSARRVRGGAHVVLSEIITEIRTWRPAVIGIETVAYQKALKEFLVDRLAVEGINIGIIELQSGAGRGKRARIEELSIPFQQGRVILRKGIPDSLEYELLTWTPKTRSGHDDVLDALSHQTDIAYPPVRGQSLVTGTDWYDLSPKERQRRREEKEGRGRREGPLTGRPHAGKWDAPRREEQPNRVSLIV